MIVSHSFHAIAENYRTEIMFYTILHKTKGRCYRYFSYPSRNKSTTKGSFINIKKKTVISITVSWNGFLSLITVIFLFSQNTKRFSSSIRLFLTFFYIDSFLFVKRKDCRTYLIRFVYLFFEPCERHFCCVCLLPLQLKNDICWISVKVISHTIYTCNKNKGISLL